MKTNLIETSGVCRLEMRALEHASFTGYYLTAMVDGAMPADAAADHLFEQVAATLAHRGIQPICEKLYGLTGARAEVLSHRDAIYRGHGLDRTMPATWIQGTPVQGCEFAGLQLWGIAPHDREKRVATVENSATGRGRLWTGRGFRMLHLPSVRGTDAGGSLATGPVAQAARMFNNVELGLREHGMRYTQVVRTWIYVARLLEWYGEMNRVRTELYRRAGIGVEGGPEFPASTGIMGRSEDEECIMDALALDSDGPEFARAEAIVRSPRQDSSFTYGSSFSRGMTLDIEGRRTVHISGTASIDAAGATTHLGDAEHQSLDTLMNVAAILNGQGGGLQHITSATLFCKDRESWEAWERVSKMLGVPAFPKVCVIADVCRRDLLVEMEAVAVI
jgi:enamine deaminase RidA (YjgF/YER057c/UK114 family)